MFVIVAITAGRPAGGFFNIILCTDDKELIDIFVLIILYIKF